MYQIGDNPNIIIRYNEDGSITSFPCEGGNRDYQLYLAWLEEGNVPISMLPSPESNNVESNNAENIIVGNNGIETSETTENKLERIGITIEELKDVLGLT